MQTKMKMRIILLSIIALIAILLIGGITVKLGWRYAGISELNRLERRVSALEQTACTDCPSSKE